MGHALALGFSFVGERCALRGLSGTWRLVKATATIGVGVGVGVHVPVCHRFAVFEGESLPAAVAFRVKV